MYPRLNIHYPRGNKPSVSIPKNHHLSFISFLNLLKCQQNSRIPPLLMQLQILYSVTRFLLTLIRTASAQCQCLTLITISYFIIHQTHYEKSDWSRAFNQFTIACELDMINAISAADIAFIMSSSTSAWLLSPLECSP